MVEKDYFIPDRDRVPRYGLNEGERRYVAFGETGSHTQTEYRHRVIERVQALPSRLQDLIYDIEILYYGNDIDGRYLTRSFFEKDLTESPHTSINNELVTAQSFKDIGWGPINTIVDRDDIREDHLRIITPPELWENDGDKIPWGSAMARLTLQLHSISDGSLNPAKYIWHHILAVTSDADISKEEHQDRVSKLINEVETMAETHWRSSYNMYELFRREDRRESQRRMICKKLRDEEIYPTSALCHQITGNLSEDSLMVSERNVEEEIQNLIEESPLRQFDQLITILRGDINTITNTKPAGIDLVSTMRKIWGQFISTKSTSDDKSTFESVSVEQLSYETSEWKSKRDEWDSQGGSMTQACRRISDEETISSDAKTSGGLTNGDILRESDGPAFTLTKYGAFLAYHLFEQERDMDWLYEFGPVPGFQYEFEEELIAGAAEEMGIDISPYARG
jgi:hypothetical protein